MEVGVGVDLLPPKNEGRLQAEIVKSELKSIREKTEKVLGFMVIDVYNYYYFNKTKARLAPSLISCLSPDLGKSWMLSINVSNE